MEMHVTLNGRGDLGGQIYRQVKAAILSGRLMPGQPLPPSRELASRLSVSRNTVTAAYDRLIDERLAQSRAGAGVFVRQAAGPSKRPHEQPPPGAVSPSPIWDRIAAPPPEFFADAPRYDLRPGIPDPRLFPYETWRRLTSQALRMSSMGTGWPIDPAGLPELRAAIARHIGVSRAVQVEPENIIVTQGTQQAMDLIGRTLLRPGDCVAIEDPGYTLVRNLFRSQGAEVRGVPLDSEGIRVSLLPDHTRIVYVTPSHHYPLGSVMSDARRHELLEWARERDAVVIEDDYDTEFRYDGRPLEPLHNHDDAGRVIYVGTFSKVMLHTLRIGFVAVPASLTAAMRTAKFLTDWHTPQPTQVAMLGFIEEGLLAKHIRRMRHEYRKRHDRIVDVLNTRFSDMLTVIPSNVGLHLAALTQPGVRDQAVAADARSRGVGILPISRFREGDSPDGLVLGYGAIAVADIDDALAALHSALRTFQNDP
ncbi:MAG: PLP-dependent aminotransferase family protein [Mycobacteriaceae bacterium]|nr:PLP-dependent aminotransferase family protein [Mycobacteriaceae bacterium]